MAATNEQVQAFSDNFVRPLCELIKQTQLNSAEFKSLLDDVYANLAGNPTWVDERNDNPPHLATPSDILAINGFVTDFLDFYNQNGDRAIVEKLIVRSLV